MTNDDHEADQPTGPLEEEPGADAWVDQWVSLFGDDPGSAPGPDRPGGAEPRPDPPPPAAAGADARAEPESGSVPELDSWSDSELEPGPDLELDLGSGSESESESVRVGPEEPVARPPADRSPADRSPTDRSPTDRSPTEQSPPTEAPGRFGLLAEPPTWSPDPSPGPEPLSEEGQPPDDDVATIEAWQRAQERSRRQARVRANQRAARQMRQLAPDRNPVQATLAPASVHSGDDERPESVRRLGWVAGTLVAAILGLIGYLFIGPGSSPAERQAGVASASEPASPATTPDLDLPVGASVRPASIQELALSTVQVVGLDDDLQPQCAGSGVIVAGDGTILTNAHVVRSDEECRFTSLGIGVTVDSSSPPELLYRAEVVLLRLGVDLAVLRVSGPLGDDESVPWPRSFPAAPLGDSDTVELGDSIRILGYPVIGGDTITLTTGSVSGFTSQVGLGSQALIKTDATISAGNSGGLAVDEAGRVVGIPTKARASERGPAVDCRPVSDTNDDGLINDEDTCVSVGGFVNGVRPINLSLPLLAAAGISGPVGGPDPEPLDLTRVELSNPRFSLGVTDDKLPEGEVVTAVAGIPRLCFFVDWEGIPPGALWDGAWYVDNVIQVGRATYTGRIWEEGEDDLHFTLCIEADEGEGLPPGVYEIALYLERQVEFVEGIELTAEPVETVEATWRNETGRELCGLAINPAAISRQVGLNELPDGAIILPDGEWTTELPVGSYVVETYGCDGELVANRLDALEITESASFRIES